MTSITRQRMKMVFMSGELYPLYGARWVCGKCGKEYSESDLIKVSDEEFGFYQYPNANHAAAIDFEAYFGF